MKRFILLLSTFLVIASSGLAQSHLIKIGVPALIYSRANLNYEFVLDQKSSINLRVGAMFPRNFPVNTNLIQDPNQPAAFRIESGKWTAYGFIPSYRIYYGRHNDAPHGFYLNPYMAYNSNNFKFNIEYDTDVQMDISGTFDMNLKGIGAGLMIGNQWVINESFVIDFNYLGLGFGVQAIGLTFRSSDPNVDYEELRDELETDLGNSSNTGTISDVKVLDDGIKVKATGFSPQWKMSLSFGYLF